MGAAYLLEATSGRWKSLLVLGLVLLPPAAAVVCSHVVGGALMYLKHLLAFYSCTVSFSEYDALGTHIKLFWSGFVYSKSGD